MMKILFLYIGSIIMFLSCCNNNGTSDDNNEKPVDGYNLVWQDGFNYSGLPDSTKWIYDTEGNDEGWGNNEAQYYTDADQDNAWVENGTLSITAHKENFRGKEYTSARLMSKADWQYGKIEVSAKLPTGRGTWSAIWVMPGGWTYKDGNWPDVGEIDIMEHVGHDLGVIHASAHSKDYQWQKQTQKTATISVSDVHSEFHTYILDWTPDMLRAYVDDSLYFEYKNECLGETKWPYDKAFYIIMNVAVGGAWGSLEGIDKEAFPQTMEVDYVRVYQKEF